MSNRLVWYVSYGSNLSRSRFMCYIKGGRFDENQPSNPGCNDRCPPRADLPLTIPHKLFFAGRSARWGNKGIAFVTSEVSRIPSFCRMWLITAAQFEDVVRQEQGLNPHRNNEPTILPSWEQIEEMPFCFLNPNNPNVPLAGTGRSSYSKLLNLGSRDGCLKLTFTATGPEAEMIRRLPHKSYVDTIVRGLTETFPRLSDENICNYLEMADGLSGRLNRGVLLRWISECSVNKPSLPSSLSH